VSRARQHVCAFDFDGTLTEGDNVVPFLRRLMPSWRVALGLAARPSRLLPALARRDRDLVKAIATDVVFTGRPRLEVESLALAFAGELVDRRMRPDTLGRLRWHQQQGHQVVLVSASYEVYLRPLGAALGLDGVLATRLEVADDDRFTGRLDGPNCRAAEKLTRLEAWLAEHSLARDQVVLWAYGDSAGDRQLLDAADHPVWVQDPLDSVVPSV